MNNIVPTAEEFRINIEEKINSSFKFPHSSTINSMLIEFAKLHIEDIIKQCEIESESQHGYIDFDTLLKNKLKQLQL